MPGKTSNRNRNTMTPQDDDHPMNRVFDFKTRPGLALVRPEIAKRLSAACKPPKEPIINHGVRPGVASVRKDVAEALAKAATPPQSDWTADDIENQNRVAAEVERALDKMYVRMILWIAATGIALGVAIHFLGKK